MSAARRPTLGHDPASVMAGTGDPARKRSRRDRLLLARRLPALSFMCWMSRASRSHGAAAKIWGINLDLHEGYWMPENEKRAAGLFGEAPASAESVQRAT